jgi:hypothetical protein
MKLSNMPGFTAEASLYKAVGNNQHTTELINSASENTIVPQLPNCGPWVPLRWPDGISTGACTRDCTTVLGGHYFESCPCGGNSGGGNFGGFGGGNFGIFGDMRRASALDFLVV